MNIKLFSLAVLLIGCLTGCGGDSSLTGIDGSGGGSTPGDQLNPDTPNTPNPNTPNPDTQVTKPISAIGPITELTDQLTINGIEFDLSQSRITVDGESASSQDLRVGQVVNITGTFNPDLNTGDANTVTYDTNVLGPIDSLDLVNRKITVMGQSVFFDDKTIFNGTVTQFSQLKLNYIVRVSGQINANGGINATYIEFVAENIDVPGTADLLEVTGRIKNLNQSDLEFEINELVLDYSNATLQAEPNDGVLVQVLGSSFDSAGRFEASAIEIVDISLGIFGSSIQLEGLITEFDLLTSSFSVSSLPIITDENTIIQGGNFEDLNLNTQVEIEGKINENDEILADRIIILNAGDIMILAASNPDLQRVGNTLIFNGGWAIINTSESTYFKDNSDVARDPLFLSDLQPSDFLEIWGKRINTDNDSFQLTATRIIRKNRRGDFGEYFSSMLITTVDDVQIFGDRFEYFTSLNAIWKPFLAGTRVDYYDEQGNEFDLTDPNFLVGKRIQATFRRADLGFIGELEKIIRIEILP